MKSDNWNFLSNLLGTPSPSEPPEEAEKKEESSAEGSTESAKSAGEAVGDGDEGGQNVLDALRAEVPASILPGFGASSEPESVDRPTTEETAHESVGSDNTFETGTGAGSDDESTDELSMDFRAPEEIDAAWGDLASELGVEPNSVPPPRPTRPSQSKPEPSSRSERRPPAKRQSSGGFGHCLIHFR